ERAAGPSAAAEFFFAGAERRKISPGAGAELEEHRFARSQVHDGFHVVIHRLDETGAALGIFILGFGPLGLAGFGIVKPIATAGAVADAILVMKADIEPDRRIKRAVLVQAQPCQFVVENLAFGFGEVAVLDTPIGNRASDAMNELSDGGLALGSALFPVEIL